MGRVARADGAGRDGAWLCSVRGGGRVWARRRGRNDRLRRTLHLRARSGGRARPQAEFRRTRATAAPAPDQCSSLRPISSLPQPTPPTATATATAATTNTTLPFRCHRTPIQAVGPNPACPSLLLRQARCGCGQPLGRWTTPQPVALQGPRHQWHRSHAAKTCQASRPERHATPRPVTSHRQPQPGTHVSDLCPGPARSTSWP